MNLYFHPYGKGLCDKETRRNLFNFGLEQFGFLLDYLGIKHDSLTDPSIANLFELTYYFRGENILQQSNIGSGYLYYIVKGIAVGHLTDGDKQTLVCLKNEGNVIYNQAPFGVNFSAKKTVVARSSLFCLRIRLDSLSELIHRKDRKGFQNFFLKLQQYEMDFQYKLLSLMRLPGEEMIAEVNNKFPGFFETFFAKDIAKLLGIKEETLSRLKNNLLCIEPVKPDFKMKNVS